MSKTVETPKDGGIGGCILERPVEKQKHFNPIIIITEVPKTLLNQIKYVSRILSWTVSHTRVIYNKQ